MTLLVAEAYNVFASDEAENTSKHRNLQSFTLPELEEIEQDLNAGGAIGELAIGGLGLKKLEIKLKLFGYDPQVMSQFGLYAVPYTFYGAIRDKDTGRAIEVKTVAWGRLGKITQDESKRGDMLGHDHAIREILRYSTFFDKAEKYFYDQKTTDWRIDGVSRNADVRRILRIPGA